jgi:hypothetical protein
MTHHQSTRYAMIAHIFCICSIAMIPFSSELYICTSVDTAVSTFDEIKFVVKCIFCKIVIYWIKVDHWRGSVCGNCS